MENKPRKNAAGYIPQPIRRDGAGFVDLGPRDVMRDLENPDMLVPPPTDAGTIPHLKFSFSDTYMTLNHGGWSRQVTVRELPIATSLAGVNMALTPGGVRELHWHKQSEWAYMIWGRARVTAVDQNGRNFIADVGKGDLWFFPAGIPHSIQGLEGGSQPMARQEPSITEPVMSVMCRASTDTIFRTPAINRSGFLKSSERTAMQTYR